MVHRLLSIPLSATSFNLELDTIKEIAYNNGYDHNFINKIVSDFRKHFHKKLIKQRVYRPTISLGEDFDSENKLVYKKIRYFNNFPKKLYKYLKTINIIPGFYNRFSLRNIFVNNKIDKLPKFSNSGIYNFKCRDCNFEYVGQTGRTLISRFSEHIAAYRNNNA